MSHPLSIHKRIQERHPEIEEQDVLDAWENCLCSAYRKQSLFEDYVAVGFDRKGRLLELVLIRKPDGTWLVYHAFTPPTKKVLRELNLIAKGK